MKSWMLIHLLLLSLLIHEAQGIRLIKKGTPSDGQNLFYKTSHGRSNDGVEKVILCKGYHCSGRKLMVSPISSTTNTAKNDQDKKNKEKNGRKEENLSVDSSSSTHHRQPTVQESYPDILDLSGMDYSQARRKPPIHN